MSPVFRDSAKWHLRMKTDNVSLYSDVGTGYCFWSVEEANFSPGNNNVKTKTKGLKVKTSACKNLPQISGRRWGGGGGGQFPKKNFSALRAWVLSENKGGGPPGPSVWSATVPSLTYSCTVLTLTSKKGPGGPKSTTFHPFRKLNLQEAGVAV